MYEFKFADIGEGIHEGKLLEWLVKKGDTIKNGDSLFLVETDKVNAEIPSPLAGRVADLKADEGDIIKVGDVVVIIDDGSSAASGMETQDDKVSPEAPVEAQAEEKGAGVVGEITVSNDVIPSFHEQEAPSDSKKKKKVLATPVARKLAKDLGIDITVVEGSGTQGRVMKDDIRAYHASNAKTAPSAPSPSVAPVSAPPVDTGFSGPVEFVELSSVRRSISNAMTLSKQSIPHAVMMDEFDVTDLVSFRREAKEAAEIKGVKLTYLPFIIKALSIALKEYPVFNAVYDKANERLIYKKYYNVGIAADTDKGLLVPVIKGVDHLSILDIAQEMNTLVESARNHTISLDKLQDGTISITNYGAIGSLFGTPIIKYPEVAILGIGKIVRRPVFGDNGEIVARHIMPVSLGIDHRIIDGADAGRFANRLKELLSNPKLLLMS